MIICMVKIVMIRRDNIVVMVAVSASICSVFIYILTIVRIDTLIGVTDPNLVIIIITICFDDGDIGIGIDAKTEESSKRDNFETICIVFHGQDLFLLSNFRA